MAKRAPQPREPREPREPAAGNPAEAKPAVKGPAVLWFPVRGPAVRGPQLRDSPVRGMASLAVGRKPYASPTRATVAGVPPIFGAVPDAKLAEVHMESATKEPRAMKNVRPCWNSMSIGYSCWPAGNVGDGGRWRDRPWSARRGKTEASRAPLADTSRSADGRSRDSCGVWCQAPGGERAQIAPILRQN